MRLVGIALCVVAAGIVTGLAIPPLPAGTLGSVLTLVGGILGPIFAATGPTPGEALVGTFETLDGAGQYL